MDIEHLKQSLHSKRGLSEAYTPELRAEAVIYAEQQRERGRYWSAIATELGVSRTSLRNWSRTVTTSNFVELQVVNPEPDNLQATRLTLISPSGFVVTGVDLEGMGRLLMVVG